MQRYLDGRTLKLERFRQLRENLTMRLWAVFKDDLERLRMPDWARTP